MPEGTLWPTGKKMQHFVCAQNYFNGRGKIAAQIDFSFQDSGTVRYENYTVMSNMVFSIDFKNRMPSNIYLHLDRSGTVAFCR
jgi:hypothetical protein